MIKNRLPQTDGIIDLYNKERPHMNIDTQIPAMAHTQNSEQTVYWKNYYS